MTLISGTKTADAPKLEAICAGDPWEMGFAQGESLRPKVQSALSVLSDLEAFRRQKPRWMPMRLFQKIAEIKAGRFLKAALATELADGRNRLLGLAAGAEVRPNSLFLLNAMEAVLSDISRSSNAPIAAACSALAVTGRSSTSGAAMLAHNFDYLPVVQPLYTVRENRPAGKLRSLEFTAAPLIGAVDGVNEAGLCITYNYAYVIDKPSTHPTISMRITEALGRCRTVPQAVEFLTTSKRWGGGLLMLADAEGNIESLELSNTKSTLRPKSGDGDRLFHTNRFETKTMAAVEIGQTATYSERAPQALRNRRIHQSSDVRDQRFRERLAALKQLDADRMIKLMSDHGPDGQPSADSICMHSDYWHTTATLQLFPKERQLRVSYDAACQANLVTFAL